MWLLSLLVPLQRPLCYSEIARAATRLSLSARVGT
jgi:hypothetical protein